MSGIRKNSGVKQFCETLKQMKKAYDCAGDIQK